MTPNFQNPFEGNRISALDFEPDTPDFNPEFQEESLVLKKKSSFFGIFKKKEESHTPRVPSND
jgi:hypothetical protein